MLQNIPVREEKARIAPFNYIIFPLGNIATIITQMT